MGKIKKCLFPVAGYGTRFLPATKSMPKEMLPILNKPLIQYAVEEAFDAGIHTMVFVTGRAKRSIEDYFDINYELEEKIKGTEKQNLLSQVNKLITGCTFFYVRQNFAQGLGDAILKGADIINNEPFVTILADDLCIGRKEKNVITQMLALYEKYKCSIIAIEEIEEENISKYGIIDGIEIEKNVFEIKNMIEKPNIKDAPSNLGAIGRYVLEPSIFSYIRKLTPSNSGEIQITDAILKQAQEQRAIAYKIDEARFDCGSIDGFVKATNHLYNNRYKK